MPEKELHEVVIGSDLSIKKKNLPTDPFYKAVDIKESRRKSQYTVLIALYSAEYPLLLLIHHSCITLSAKMTVGKLFPSKLKRRKKVLVWHYLAREPFVDFLKFLSIFFIIWSLTCAMVDNWISFWMQKTDFDFRKTIIRI